MVEKVLEGFDGTVLAYGQTGTGKTYTMGLHAEKTDEINAGIIPRVLKDLLAVETTDEEAISVSISFIEIYNEKVFDLLSDSPSEQVNVKGQKFAGATKRSITTLDDAAQFLKEGLWHYVMDLENYLFNN